MAGENIEPATLQALLAAVKEALRNEGPTSQAGLLRIPEDERLRGMITEIGERQLATFEKRVEAIVHAELSDTLRRIGIRIDDEHIDQTADDFRAMMKTHRSLNRLITGLGITLVSGMFLGLLKLLGLNLPTGGEH